MRQVQESYNKTKSMLSFESGMLTLAKGMKKKITKNTILVNNEVKVEQEQKALLSSKMSLMKKNYLPEGTNLNKWKDKVVDPIKQQSMNNNDLTTVMRAT
jgi:hypothetical protein